MNNPPNSVLDNLTDLKEKLTLFKESFGWMIFCILILTIISLVVSIHLVLNAAGGGILGSLISIILMLAFTLAMHIDYMLAKNIRAIEENISAIANSKNKESHDQVKY